MRMRNEFPNREIVEREHIKVRIDEKQRSAFNLTRKPRNKYKCLNSKVLTIIHWAITVHSYKLHILCISFCTLYPNMYFYGCMSVLLSCR